MTAYPAGTPVAEVFREFRFEAAHRLPHVPPDHKDARLHGHSYRVVLRLRGPVHPVTGYVCDFADLTAAFRRVDAKLDHRVLNEVPGLQNPTCEVIAVWIWSEISAALPRLSTVEVHESPWSGCAYNGPTSAQVAQDTGGH